MSKIVIKNSINNPLMTFLKNFNISFQSSQISPNEEKIFLNINSDELKSQAEGILDSYSDQLYHDTILTVEGKLINKYNYFSNQFENITEFVDERELPNYYIENLNEQNEIYELLKTINSKIVDKEYIMNIATAQQSLRSRSPEQISQMSNVYIGNSFQAQRSHQNLDSFCYYNKLLISSYEGEEFIGRILKDLNIQEEFFDSFIGMDSPIRTVFSVNNQDNVQIDTFDVLDKINNSDMRVDDVNKLVLSEKKTNANYMSNNFNKFLLGEFLNNNGNRFVKKFHEIHANEQCSKEYLIYKIEKFRGEETSPLQSFWMYESEMKEYIDYQIKLDSMYKYVVKCYCVIYGTQTRVSGIERNNNGVAFTFSRSPSYRMAILDFYDDVLQVSPTILPEPYVKFLNESNSKNYIKIYLDLNNESKREQLIAVTESDSELLEMAQVDEEGKSLIEYNVEDGKFEVFRTREKPMSYEDFQNSKILDVRNNYSSTSVVFKDFILPNTKYYYIFRAINGIGIPSNPTKVFEVEMIKDASKTKIVSKTVKMKKQISYHDKKFKNLLQITPAFNQDIFDDLSTDLIGLDTYRKKINDLTLGTATDKVWGKKFKIRVKSKDTGKIVDLNVKFNLVKDNTD